MSYGGNDPGIPALLMHAAQSAAQADGLVPENSMGANPMQAQSMMQQAQAQKQQEMMQQMKAPMPSPSGGGKKKGLPLRRGKWTPEEEAYANRLIQEFKAGLLPLTDGTTLRTFLSKLLNCDPMRISKKFVGSNCIGKQVFRRRTADLNRLTPEQIQKSRSELSELERRFLERVAQTNRVKSSGVGGGGAPPPPSEMKEKEIEQINPPSPPWLQPPLGYKQGQGAAMAAANLAGGEANSRAAAAGRALLQGFNPGQRKPGGQMGQQGNASLLAMAELQRRASQERMLQNMTGSAQNLLAAANGSGSALAQMAQNASAARMAGLGGGNSVNNLMLKTGFSRDQLSQLARERGLSSASLSNMIDRKNSFDALMSLDFQSLQSIDNLANLIQTGGQGGQTPASGMKNADFANQHGSSNSLSNAARRLASGASSSHMESLLRSISNSNVRNGSASAGRGEDADGTSNANLQSLLQNIQSGTSMGSLLGQGGNGTSAASLANLLRDNSSTGLTALRMQDGLNQRNSSVEDFLSLVAAGDIPHQDPSLLNVPLMQAQAGQQGGGGGGGNDMQQMLAQQQLLAQATGNPALANALASRSFGNMQGSLSQSNSAAAFLARAAGEQGGSTMSLKRKLLEMDGFDGNNGSNKR
mmetsp:Transcript_27392/g.42129  ORF Transcript_27392/g.42129 Transcript_27392/m.42129 type:complete len:643 (+) Transcript_27392:141-2069(+)|eukprot:CAMPEP_0117050354 /NCGR_PEP_ID=MMETSP0472-20121206/34763_1 /TAXON_ID=693140 ORGANISM="Tiarina fusus, Strain LIS" /NCGR_SAMPLE_ID=MMETSP0472 /ASSEMBLY_ACC=CAM_ASM_000603 /LENGTH=642 /DNA_ID=CAMNT_0004764097 /DNA_START=141 /DNA_END=2069 /DNA_ORIENTATION=+